jgi:CRISPR-associated protein Csm4
MAHMLVARLTFTSAVHLGEPGIGLEGCSDFCPSDTLFGALCNAWALAFGEEDLEKTVLVACINGMPPFRLSSAFPYRSEIFYLPRPMIPPFSTDRRPDERIAIGKQIRFVPAEMFPQWLRHRLSVTDAAAMVEAYDRETAQLSRFALLPRLRMDREEGRSNLYFCGVRWYDDQAGLYCFLDIQQDSIATKLQGAFELLGELGLGGERALGCGKFHPTFAAVEAIPALASVLHRPVALSVAWCLLSLYHPSREELQQRIRPGSLQGYEWLERGGWVDSPFLDRPRRRQTCSMLKEGSVLTFEPWGELVDVTPTEGSPHHVYRYGYAFAVPTPVGGLDEH